MKKTSLTRRNALITSRELSAGALALFAVLIILALRLVAPNMFLQLFTPVFRLSDGIAASTKSFTSSFRNAADLARENESLTNENAALILENKTLTDKLGAIEAIGGEEGIPAGVVARPPESPYDTLVLSAGARAGVTLGMEVFARGDTPLGMVTSVTSDFSRATLFSAPGVSTAGWVGPKNFPITITGGGAGTLTALVPRSLESVVGDVVSVPGPGMRAIGTVAQIDSDPSSPSVTLRIAPGVNLFSTSWVVLRDIGGELRTAAASSTPRTP